MNDLPYHVREPEAAEVPLLVSIPHTGVEVPEAIAARFANDHVRELPDTDWHLHVLYDFVPRLGARTLFARFNRYVVDLNRPRDRAPLYPGRAETALVPVQTFAGEPLYRAGEEPDEAEVEARVQRYWQPYHARLVQELARLRQRFGYALLWDAHSITSRVPRLFAGELPIFMLGDAKGRSAAADLTASVLGVQARSGMSHRANDPFQGGWITRGHGRPAEGVHALQLEMAQRAYMDEGPPYRYRDDLAARLRPVLEAMLRAFVAAGAHHARPA